MAQAIDWARVDALTAQGRSARAIAREIEIPWSSFYWQKQKRERPPCTPTRPPWSGTLGSCGN
jgi:hypothetical protein